MLETDRLLVREFTLDDAEAYYPLCTDPAIIRYTHDPGSVTTVEHARDILRARPIADYQKHGFGRLACVLKSSGLVIGFAGLRYLDDFQGVDIGYRFLPPYWGKGLATEAGRSVLRDGFARLKLERIIGLVATDNVASVRVLRKLGLTFSAPIEYQSVAVAKYVIQADAVLPSPPRTGERGEPANAPTIPTGGPARRW
jgi:RimJ/RimL family protein N-acetyltransferase